MMRADERDALTAFVERMRRLDIEVKLVGNYPWVYLDSINGVKVEERFLANHGFTIAFLPIREGKKIEITDIGETFKLIRKYAR